MAKCPAHSDKTPSLSIREAARRRVLIHCYAGCEQSSVIASLRHRGLWDADYRRPNLQIVGNRFDADDEARKAAALAIRWRLILDPGGSRYPYRHQSDFITTCRTVPPAPDGR
jgi:hypothetical protein